MWPPSDDGVAPTHDSGCTLFSEESRRRESDARCGTGEQGHLSSEPPHHTAAYTSVVNVSASIVNLPQASYPFVGGAAITWAEAAPSAQLRDLFPDRHQHVPQRDEVGAFAYGSMPGDHERSGSRCSMIICRRLTHRAATSVASTRVRPRPGVAAVDTGGPGRVRSLRKRDHCPARHSRAEEESLRPVTTAVTNKRMTRFPGQPDVDVLALKLRRCLNDHIFWVGNSSASKSGRLRGTFRHRACARRQICAFDHQWMRAGVSPGERMPREDQLDALTLPEPTLYGPRIDVGGGVRLSIIRLINATGAPRARTTVSSTHAAGKR